MKLTAKQIDRYRLDPAAFIEERLIDPITNRPFVLLPAERAFVKLAFEIDEEIGRLRYPEMVYSTGRKGGKTGFASLIRAADQDGAARQRGSDREGSSREWNGLHCGEKHLHRYLPGAGRPAVFRASQTARSS